jgi:hypothetical protein
MGQNKPALRERTGLVRADAGDPTDIFDSYGAADKRLASSQTIHTDPKKEGHCDGEFLREGRNRQGHPAQQGVDRAVPLQQADRGKEHAERDSCGQKDCNQPG